MAQLTYEVREVAGPGGATATLVELIGSVDPQSLEAFENLLDEMIESGRGRVMLDMQYLKYINSTGMGMLVQCSDSFRDAGGGLVLLRIQPKVLLVVEMLGLQELFRIAATEAEAFALLAGGDLGPANIQVRLEGDEGGDRVPAAVAVEPSEVPSIELDEDAALNRTLACGACGAELSLPAPGAYRCPRCRAAIEVNPGGIVQTYPEQSAALVELALAPEPAYLAGARPLLTAAGRRAGLAAAEAADMAEAAGACLEVLAASALAGAPAHEMLHLFAQPGAHELTVRIYCGGQALADAESLAPCRAAVDRLEYQALPVGNLVTLVKRSAAGA